MEQLCAFHTRRNLVIAHPGVATTLGTLPVFLRHSIGAFERKARDPLVYFVDCLVHGRECLLVDNVIVHVDPFRVVRAIGRIARHDVAFPAAITADVFSANETLSNLVVSEMRVGAFLHVELL
jgi:hypothetical protein